MNENLLRQAEIEKLARLLEVPADRLAALRKMSGTAVKELGERISDTLYDAGEVRFRRLAKVSTIAPAGVAAALAEHLLGPLMSAMVAVNLEPRKAAELAGHLSAEFLSDVSLHLDPRRAADIMARLDDDLVVRVSAVLRDRREFITLGQFVGHVSHNATIRAIEPATSEQLLNSAFFVEAEERFDRIITALSDERVRDIIITAAKDDLWVQALSVVDAVGEANRKRLADLAGGLDVDILGAMAESADEQQVIDVVLPLIGVMSAENRRRIAGIEYLHRPDVIERVVQTAYATGLVDDLHSVVEFLPADARKDVEAAERRVA